MCVLAKLTIHELFSLLKNAKKEDGEEFIIGTKQLMWPFFEKQSKCMMVSVVQRVSQIGQQTLSLDELCLVCWCDEDNL